MPGKSPKKYPYAMKSPYEMKATPEEKAAAKSKAIKGGMPKNVADKVFKMDSSHTFKMKPAAYMKEMYMGSVYSMDPDNSVQERGLFNQFDDTEDNRSAKEIQDEEYRIAQESNSFGPQNRRKLTRGSNNFEIVFGGDGNKKPPVKPVSNIKRDDVSKVSKIETGNNLTVPLNNEIKVTTLNNKPIKENKFAGIKALTPRETRRNERNVKFLERRIRRGLKRGKNVESRIAALNNAKAQQSRNRLPGEFLMYPKKKK